MRAIGYVLIVFLQSLAAVSAHGADFEKGLEACKRGGYQEARQHLYPLAKRGDAAAQLT